MSLNLIKQNKAFGGWVKQFKHASNVTKTDMTFSVFLPKESEAANVPVLYYLSGLTCTDENFTTKAGAQRVAAQFGLALVAPDTSPRTREGEKIEGEDDSWDFGSGAGFYVNATTPKFAKNYNMYDYVTKELPDLVAGSLPIDPERKSIFGHSMGGHGALICALKNPGMFKSCSTFAAICHPSNCPWGEKAFTGYLGEDRSKWAEYDATELIGKYKGAKLPILCDQGSADEFLAKGQLLPGDLQNAAQHNSDIDLEMRMQDGYDHSYYFIATFVEDHIRFHNKYLE